MQFFPSKKTEAAVLSFFTDFFLFFFLFDLSTAVLHNPGMPKERLVQLRSNQAINLTVGCPEFSAVRNAKKQTNKQTRHTHTQNNNRRVSRLVEPLIEAER